MEGRNRLLSGIGISTVIDSFDAGREAAENAVQLLGMSTPALVMVFTTPRYELNALLGGIRSVTGDALLVGCTSSGEIANGIYLGFQAGVAVLVLGGGTYRFGAASASQIYGNLEKAGQEIARESREIVGESPHAAIVLFVDQLAGDLQQLVNGVYRVTGTNVCIAGGAAGDEQKFIRTFVFHNGHIIEKGAVALWIASNHPLKTTVAHGWKPIGIPLLVTRTEGTEILELAGRPAARVYEEQLGFNPGELAIEKFWGTSIQHPLGLLQYDGSTIIRVARSKNDKGVLKIQGCVPPVGSAVQVMDGTSDSLLGIVKDVTTEALSFNKDAGVVLAFSCAARATILGVRASEEARIIQQTTGTVPSFGFYCCGEFARSAGVLSTHNATLTSIAL
ncbi:MAG: FIST C-terminal domain-containing protein [Chitinispirillaceae bacterium]|nr:FIST C-terminal domain-containing protein [Chitinispirillaceae bacterium]